MFHSPETYDDTDTKAFICLMCSDWMLFSVIIPSILSNTSLLVDSVTEIQTVSFIQSDTVVSGNKGSTKLACQMLPFE